MNLLGPEARANLDEHIGEAEEAGMLLKASGSVLDFGSEADSSDPDGNPGGRDGAISPRRIGRKEVGFSKVRGPRMSIELHGAR